MQRAFSSTWKLAGARCGCAPAQAARYLDSAAVELGDQFCYAQAESHAFGHIGTSRIDAVETVEDAAQVLHGNADSTIGHDEVYGLIHLASYPDVAVGRGVLDCIFYDDGSRGHQYGSGNQQTIRFAGRGIDDNKVTFDGVDATGFVPSPAYLAATNAKSPALAQLLAYYPAGQTPTGNVNVYQFNSSGRQVQNEDFGIVRLDRTFSQRTSAYFRFNLDQAHLVVPNGDATGLLGDTLSSQQDPKNGVLSLLHTFRASVVNDLQLAVNRTPFYA